MDATVAQSLLLDAAIGGDARSFESLATQHRTMIWSVCLRITGNTYDAEDALQDTLLAAWRGIGRFRRDASFGTWIYRIAANAALAVIRSRHSTETEIADDFAPERDFAEQLASADLVQQTLKTLHEDLRVALVLRELCDFTYAQIAEYQGVGVATVKSRISRARHAFEAAIGAGFN
ncbi:RNA polymerase sigma-70 factor (ECF subfamily) [Arthrobacter sp. PvP102]|uniref:RNA polymerase sigma factor n=1 Tax=unclassified Arthrobacter TaxID=235627 RepID=UPI001AE83C7D|nr:MULTISPECIES: RNA polymerase sigma factor [unclassified Arthrobacter]MBP1232544.1 RNA polymerase sigma-70 factor (ECF subfamily) [Arthrobacter sp. PvP103]MBP1237679.1 RNA polymerase sigma-70 factor (ECF subfamily) [Arthrobacter sp. PvP102]